MDKTTLFWEKVGFFSGKVAFFMKLPTLAEKFDLWFSGFFIGPSMVFLFYTVATLPLSRASERGLAD